MPQTLLLFMVFSIAICVFRWVQFSKLVSPPPQVFISYRRTDTEGVANELMRSLTRQFGVSAVFLDTSTISPGEQFPETIATRLRYCDVVISLIGSQWEAVSDSGERRIDQDGDWVRKEISLALEYDKTIIPVLVNGRPKPPIREELPDNIRELADISAIPLSQAATNFNEIASKIAAICRKNRPSSQSLPYAIADIALPITFVLFGIGLQQFVAESTRQMTPLSEFKEHQKKTEELSSKSALALSMAESANSQLVELQQRLNSVDEKSANHIPCSLAELQKALKSGENGLNPKQIRSSYVQAVITFQQYSNGKFRFLSTTEGCDPAHLALTIKDPMGKELTHEQFRLKAASRFSGYIELTDWTSSGGFTGTSLRIVPLD